MTRAKITRAFMLAIGLLFAPSAKAENWVLLQANVFPEGCESIASCLENTTQDARNLMAMSQTETDAFLLILSEMADVKNVKDIPVATLSDNLPLIDIVPRLQILEVQGKVDALTGLPGVYFDASRVTGEGASEAFVETFSAMLASAGIPILTEEEAMQMPGAAKMSVSLSLTRDNAGCIIPFRASLSIKEQVVLVRDPNIKLETTTWSVSVAQNFANSNYLPTAALMDAANQFISDYKTANNIEG